MGNVGRSSTGCATCRKRKVKCDEARPGCRRCSQVRKPCPGYPFQIPLGLRLPPETQPPRLPGPVPLSAIQLEASAKLGKVQPVPVEAYLPHSTTALPPDLAGLRNSSSPSDVEIKAEEKDARLHTAPQHDDRPESPPKYDIQHQSICFFVHLFCFQGAKLYSFPVIDFVPYILENASPNSSVLLAATAVSRMTLADQYSGTDIRLQTGHDYSRAIKSTFTSIRNPKSATTDSTVVAVWLLGLYEAINSVLSHGRRTSGTTQHKPPKTPEEEWQSHISHIRGAMHLLRLRGATQFTNPRSEKIFRIFKAAIQMRLFVLNSVTSKDFGGLELDIYQDEHEFVPSETANRASAFFLRIARLTEEIKHFLLFSSSNHTHPTTTTTTIKAEEAKKISAKTHQLVAYAESLDRGMTGWADVEPGWQMMRVRSPPSYVSSSTSPTSASSLPKASPGTVWSSYPDHALYYFHSFWVYLYWIRFLIARIKLYEALIELLQLDPLLSPGRASLPALKRMAAQKEGYVIIIRATASELVGLTAYALGDVAWTGDIVGSVVSGDKGASEGEGKAQGKGAMQEMNVVAAMQLVIPLKSLLRSEYVMSWQKEAIDIAIILIGDGFRRRPGGLV